MPQNMGDQVALDAMQRVQRRQDEMEHADLDLEDEVLESYTPEKKMPEVTVDGPTTSAVTSSNFLRHPLTHPLILDLILLKKYGPDWLGWETETLEHVLPQDFHVDAVSGICMTKIQAVKAMHLVDTYWKNWEIFLWCTMSLNGVFPDFIVMQVPTVAQVLVSVDIANQIREDVRWTQEVKIYIEQVYRHESLLVPLEPTTFIDMDLDGIKADFKDIEKRWPQVRSSNSTPTGETTEDEQLRRMLSAYQYLEESRSRFRTQQSLVAHV